MIYAIVFGIPILLIVLGIGDGGGIGCIVAGVGILLLLAIGALLVASIAK